MANFIPPTIQPGTNGLGCAGCLICIACLLCVPCKTDYYQTSDVWGWVGIITLGGFTPVP